MTKDNKKATANGENSNQITLKEGEIMYLSVRQVDEQNYEMYFAANGPEEAMRKTLVGILNDEFNMVCIPKDSFGTVMLKAIKAAEAEGETI